MKKLLIVLIPLVLITGCASDQVIVDTKGVNMSNYESDRADCEAYANEVSTGGQVARSAGFGAAVAAAVAAIFGNSRSVGQAAGAGGVVGGAQGVVKGEQQKEQVLRNCLRGRGYKVLN